MTDLRELLERASDPPTTGATPIADDLARGRAALRKRRVGMASGALAAAVALGAAGGLGNLWASTGKSGVSPASHTTAGAPRTRATHIAPGATSINPGVHRLPFTVGYVPPGWKVQWSRTTVLDLVRSDGRPNTAVEAPTGKIVVLSRRALPTVNLGTRMSGGREFVLSHSSRDGGWTATEVRTGPGGGHLTVEGPPTVSAAEVLKVAAGCRTNPSSVSAPGVG